MARGARARRSNGSAGAWWRGFGVGLGTGVLLSVALYFTRGPGSWGPQEQAETRSGAPVAAAGKAPEFSFFTVLPDQEVPVGDEDLGSGSTGASEGIRVLTGRPAPVQPVQPPASPTMSPAPDKPPRSEPEAPPLVAATPPPSEPDSEPRAGYLIQAGSFRKASDAERARAELALHGLRADVQAVTVNGSTFHRVRLGPYEDLAALESPRETLRGAGVPHLVVKLR